MYGVYVLQSISTGRYYVGHTRDIHIRLSMHNQKRVRSTKAYAPWKVVYIEYRSTKQEAYAREMEIKSYKGGRMFHALLQK